MVGGLHVRWRGWQHNHVAVVDRPIARILGCNLEGISNGGNGCGDSRDGSITLPRESVQLRLYSRRLPLHHACRNIALGNTLQGLLHGSKTVFNEPHLLRSQHRILTLLNIPRLRPLSDTLLLCGLQRRLHLVAHFPGVAAGVVPVRRPHQHLLGLGLARTHGYLLGLFDDRVVHQRLAERLYFALCTPAVLELV